MFNQTILIDSIQNMSSNDSLTHIARTIFATPIFIIWFICLLIAFVVAACVITKKGWGEVTAIILISYLLFLIFLIFTFIYPVIPNILFNKLSLFG